MIPQVVHEDDIALDADAKAATLSRCCHAGRLHGMVQLIYAGSDKLDEVATGLGQPDAPHMALE